MGDEITLSRGTLWEFVRNATALVGLAWLVIQVVGAVWKSNGMVATGKSIELMVPPVLRDYLVGASVSADSRLRFGRSWRAEDESIQPDTLVLKAHAELLDAAFRVSSAGRINLRNKGDRERRDVVIEIGGSGIYAWTSGAESGSGVYKGIIPLGTVRAGSRIRVDVWAEAGEHALRDARVAFPDGSANVNFSEEVGGVGGFLWRTRWAFLFAVVVLILWPRPRVAQLRNQASGHSGETDRG